MTNQYLLAAVIQDIRIIFVAILGIEKVPGGDTTPFAIKRNLPES